MLLKEVKTTRRRRPVVDPSSATAAAATAEAAAAAAAGDGLGLGSMGSSLLPSLAAAMDAGADPFQAPLPGLDDDANSTAAASASAAASRLITEAEPPSTHPPRPPYASPAIAALVAEYTECVGRGAWAQAGGCLERLPQAEGGKEDERPRALAEMAGALLGTLPGRGWRVEAGGETRRRLRLVGHGGASASPERLEAEVLAPLRAAALALGADGVGGPEEEEEEEGPGAPLVLALRLEEAAAAADDDAASTAQEAYRAAAARLLITQPSLASLHCCGLALTSTSTPAPSSQLTPAALDCLLGVLALALPHHLELEAAMRALASSSSLPPWDVEAPPYHVLPPALATRPSIIPPLIHDAGESAAACALAEGLWADLRPLFHPQQQEEQQQEQGASSSSSQLSLRSRLLQQQQRGRRGDKPATPTSLPLALLERLRARWSEARRQRTQKGLEGQVLARALLGLLRRCASDTSGGEAEAEAEAAVGHILPVAFVLVEEYDREELQLLGYLAWAQAAAEPAFGRHLAWHLGIQMTVLLRCLKVAARKPRVLGPLLHCAAALLRIAGEHSAAQPQQQPSSSSSGQAGEIDRWRAALLEHLLLSLPRSAYFIPHGTTDPIERAEAAALGFVLLEGIARVVKGYGEGGGCGLVRYLRPLTQVLAMQPLEEGGPADRVLALRTLLRVLEQCAPMAHQLAHETLAQALRLYVTTTRHVPKGKHDAVILGLCREVGVRLARACEAKRKHQGEEAPLRAWVASIAAQGCPELEGFWDDVAAGPL